MSHRAIQKIQVASFFWNTVYMAHRAIIFAIAQLSCLLSDMGGIVGPLPSTDRRIRNSDGNMSEMDLAISSCRSVVSASLSIRIAEQSAYVIDHVVHPCLSAHRYCDKTADWIRMPFGVVSGVGLSSQYGCIRFWW